jgi:RNA polymerase sigma-B factor
LVNQAVVAAAPLARTIADRYRGHGVDIEDLRQVAYEHLVKAARNYRPAPGADFRSYAIPTIRGGIGHHFRDHAWAVKLPRPLQELQSRVNQTETRLAAELHRWPTYDDLAQALGVDVRDVIQAEQARGCFQPTSLDADHSRVDTVSLVDTLADPSDTYELVDQVHTLGRAISRLSGRERLILRRRLQDHRTQTAIAEEIGVSQMQVSRLLRDIMNHLRTSRTA